MGESPELKPGQVLEGSKGRYVVEKMLSVGGMGVVWLAKSLDDDKLVVIKLPRITGDPRRDRINREKLLQEVHILVLLDHPRIPRFVDLIPTDAMDIPVIEYVPGETMERLYAGKPLPEDEAVDMGVKILDIVAYIHSLNIIHRDIRPKNLIVSPEGEPYLIDFGTAKYFYEQIREIVSAPGGYTAPEQLRWSATPQSDIWSVGATLLFLLTGQHPIVYLRGYPANPQPLDVEKVIPDVSPHVAEAIRRAMMPRPEDRFASAEEMASYLRGAPVPVEREIPVLVVAGIEVPLKSDRVIIGRAPRDQKGPVRLVEEAGVARLMIRDPKAFISRVHAEVFCEGGKWYVRDLGSLNKTAVSRGLGGWEVLWEGRGRPSRAVELGDGAIIALAYRRDLGPYFTITFKAARAAEPGPAA